MIVAKREGSSIVRRYPEPVNRLPREAHAPCRVTKFGSWTSSNPESRTSRAEVENLPEVMGNILRIQNDLARKCAVEAFQCGKKDKEVINVDGQIDEDGVWEDSSIEEVENGLESWSLETSGFVPNLNELGGKVVELKFQPSSSSVVSDLTCEKLKFDNTREMPGVTEYKKLLETAERRNPMLSSLNFGIRFLEKLRATFRLLIPIKKPVGEDLEPFFPLTKEEEAEVSRAFCNSNRRKVLVTHENSNIEITGELLQCLLPGAWLNDEVINVYLELLKEREKREPKNFLKCHFFNTFFYKKLISGSNSYDFKSVRRWTSQRKLGYSLVECDKIFVPIHKEGHWCLAVINKKDEKFQYLDSLGGIDTQVLKVLARYFVDEVKDKTGKDIDVSLWKQEYVKELPGQKNGWDCGMFMIKYADFYSRDIGLCFYQKHMAYFRLRTVKEILKLKAE